MPGVKGKSGRNRIHVNETEEQYRNRISQYNKKHYRRRVERAIRVAEQRYIEKFKKKNELEEEI